MEKGAYPINVDQSIVLMKHPRVYPYLITRVVPTMYHIIVLPKGEQNQLAEIARTQIFFNKLETCLVLGPGEALYLYPDGSETMCPHVPAGGSLIHDRLRPCKALSGRSGTRFEERSTQKAYRFSSTIWVSPRGCQQGRKEAYTTGGEEPSWHSGERSPQGPCPLPPVR